MKDLITTKNSNFIVFETYNSIIQRYTGIRYLLIFLLINQN